MEILIASRNRGKIAEIKQILTSPYIAFLTFEDFPDWPDLPETGKSYEENALLKASAVAQRFGKVALADDSGLEVDVLGKAPGLVSAHYAGPGCSYSDNNAKLLRELSDVPREKRRACFRCWVAVVNPERWSLVAEGVCEGTIALYPAGSGGFGYDPIFIPDGYGNTLAELSPEEKNVISHRGKALRKMRELLEEKLEG